MARIVYLYGMRLRGFSPGCQPALGLVDAEDDIMNEYHSILTYDRPLTDAELSEFELDYLGARRKP